MRDRLIALGMRRPTRIKTEDFDVPMLTIDDFELVAIPESVSCIPADCSLARDVDRQRDLAVMCIQKAKLCLCISHVLGTQYCVLNNNQGMVNDRTTMMLLPKKGNPEICEVKSCDDELQRWVDELPEEAKYPEQLSGHPSLDLHRSLLHMIFFTTLSALHRPQVLPSAPSLGTPSVPPNSPTSVDLLDTSRKAVRRAATAITQLAQSLDAADLVCFLPTTGVTVLLPAIIIHLLDIKAPEESTRRQSLRGFCQCMQVMGKLRDLYAAADYSTAFLEAAIRKAGIHIAPFPSSVASERKERLVSTVEDLVDAGRRLDMPPPGTVNPRTLTPPPDMSSGLNGGVKIAQDLSQDDANSNNVAPVSDEEVARRLETFLASTPPESEHHSSSSSSSHHDDHSSDNHSSTDATSISHPDPTINLGNGGILGDLLTSTSLDVNGCGDGDEFKLFSTNMPTEFEHDDFETLLNMDAFGQGEGVNWGFDAGDGMDWLSNGLGDSFVN